MHDRFPSQAAHPETLSRSLADAISRGLEAEDGVAPCIVARDIRSAAFTALAGSQPAWRARSLTPMVLLGSAPASADALQGMDIAVRIASPDIASLLREQAIAGSVVWCGGPVKSAQRDAGPGRVFESLSLTELRAFGLVFQGLWASARPLTVARAERSQSPVMQPRFAGASR